VGLSHSVGRRAVLGGLASALALAGARLSAQERLEIAVLDAPGVGAEALSTAIAAIEASGSLRARVVSPEAVRRGGLSGARALLVTGGRGSRQGRALGEDGRDALRRFVRGGGGYVGICAGSYLAMQRPRTSTEESFKAAFVAAEHATGDAWQRGIAPMPLVPEDGSPVVTLHYANGPLIAPVEVEGLPAPRVLARFGGEVSSARGGTLPGQMRGAAALVATRYGEGEVVLFSPNPTLEPARPGLLVTALARVARRETTRAFAELA
jgi:glutamine amidotransferase-like uncharacterized protein